VLVPSILSSFSLSIFVRTGQGVPSEAGRLTGERVKKKEKDSGGDITFCRTSKNGAGRGA
ncbi:MAG: hypothetical protein LBC18_14940, partial [Opitutaceae bacterium]|nr:hypothetical protein [Opitutaceae bacterium]